MELLGHSKWLSNLGHRHGRHVHPIIKDILFRNINTFLHEVLRRKGETKQAYLEGTDIRSPNQKSHLTKRVCNIPKTNLRNGSWEMNMKKEDKIWEPVPSKIRGPLSLQVGKN
jgi:hypothetical protein